MSLAAQGIFLTVAGPALVFLWAGNRGYRGCRLWVTGVLAWISLVAYLSVLAVVSMEISYANSMEKIVTRRKEDVELLSHYLPDGTHVLLALVLGSGFGFAASAIGEDVRRRRDLSSQNRDKPL